MYKVKWSWKDETAEYEANDMLEAGQIFDSLIIERGGDILMYDPEGNVIRTYPHYSVKRTFKVVCRANGQYGIRLNVPSEIVSDMKLETGQEIKVTLERQP